MSKAHFVIVLVVMVALLLSHVKVPVCIVLYAIPAHLNRVGSIAVAYVYLLGLPCVARVCCPVVPFLLIAANLIQSSEDSSLNLRGILYAVSLVVLEALAIIALHDLAQCHRVKLLVLLFKIIAARL